MDQLREEYTKKYDEYLAKGEKDAITLKKCGGYLEIVKTMPKKELIDTLLRLNISTKKEDGTTLSLNEARKIIMNDEIVETYLSLPKNIVQKKLWEGLHRKFSDLVGNSPVHIHLGRMRKYKPELSDKEYAIQELKLQKEEIKQKREAYLHKKNVERELRDLKEKVKKQPIEPITVTVPAKMKKFDIKKAQELIPKPIPKIEGRKIILEEPDQPETDLRLVLYKYFDNLEEEELNTITVRKIMTDLHLKGPRAKAEILKNYKKYIAPVKPKKTKLQPITEINDETIKIINEAYKKTTEQIVDMFRAEAKKKKMPIGRKKADKIKNAYNWIKEGYNASFQKKAKPVQKPVPKPVPKFKPIPKIEARKIILEEPDGLKPIEKLTKQELTDELNARGIASRYADRPMKISEARKILREQRELDAQKVQRIMDEKKDLPPSSVTLPKTTTISYGNIRKSGKPVKFDMKKATQLISPEPELPKLSSQTELMGKEDVRIVEKEKVPASEIYTKFLFLQDLPFLPRKDNDEYNKEGNLIKKNPVTIYPEKLIPFLEFIVNHYSSSLRLNRKNFEMWDGESWFSAEFPKFIMELIGNYEDMSKSLLPADKKKQFKLLYLDWFKALSQAEKIKFLDEIMKSVRRTNYEKAQVDKLGPYSRHLLEL
jgi:hypothetical protein